MKEENNKHFTVEELNEFNVRSIWIYAGTLGISRPSAMKKAQLIEQIIKVQNGEMVLKPLSKRGRPRSSPMVADGNIPLSGYSTAFRDPNAMDSDGEKYMEGYFLKTEKGDGVLRPTNYIFNVNDPHINEGCAYPLATFEDGDLVKCLVRYHKNGKTSMVTNIVSINGYEPKSYQRKELFDKPLNLQPTMLQIKSNNAVCNMINTFMPIAKGQRGLIFAPHSTGATTILKEIAQGVVEDEKIKTIFLACGQKPEETEGLKRELNCEVIVSSVESEYKRAVDICRLAFARAKQLAKQGYDVLLLVDSITDYYKVVNYLIKKDNYEGTAAMEIRKYLSYARDFEGEGSITIIGVMNPDDDNISPSAMADMVSLINWKMVLSEELANMRLYPAIDIAKSVSKYENVISEKEVYNAVNILRRKIMRGQLFVDDIIDAVNEMQDYHEIIDYANKL